MESKSQYPGLTLTSPPKDPYLVSVFDSFIKREAFNNITTSANANIKLLYEIKEK